jgi:hypothetical protein
MDRQIRNESLPLSTIHLKYIFPAGGLLKSTRTCLFEKVKKSEIGMSVIFAALEGALAGLL